MTAWNFAPPDRYLEVLRGAQIKHALALTSEPLPYPNPGLDPTQALQDSVCAVLVSHSRSLPAEGEPSSHNSEGSSPLCADHSSPATSLALAVRVPPVGPRRGDP